MEIVGYADRLRAQPGEKVSFKVSCRASSFRAQLVRLIHGDDNPDGPGSKIDDLDSAANGEYPGRIQELHPGSFVSVPDDPLLHLDGSFTIQAWIYPTTVGKGLQGVVTKWDCNNDIGYGLFVDEEGAVSLRIGNGETVDAVSTGVAMRDAKWYFAAGVYDADEGSIRVYQTPLDHWPLQDTAAEGGGSASEGPGKTGAALVIGGSSRGDGTGFGTVGCLYNGKIDNPAIFARGLGPDEIAALRNGGSSPAGDSALVAAWDFGRDFSTSTVTDSSPNGLHGEALNMPGRAVTGHNWNGGTMDFKQAPDQYAAIRFNDDDLDDARWDTDFEYTVPEDLKSAMYAFRLTTDDAEDYIPFAVRPRTGESTAKIAFLLGTYTFLAYANEHLANNPVLIEYLDGKGMDVPFPVLPQEHYMVDNKLGGLYDLHTDGSGICYSSSRKPIVNFRPNNKQRTVGAGMGAPVLLSADLHQMDWMESQGFDFDVITDEDIHFDGLDLLSGYNVVMSDAHPEYWTEDMLIALEAYLNAGGRFMYLGGNGLYWITSVDPDRPHVIEVRRWNGTGSWRTDFAESHHSTTGEPGGLWRFRGWAPQRLVGVGMTAQGGSGINSAYRRLPDSFDPRAAFIFEGIGDDELIGDFDTLNLGWGAAGYEMDRADPALGTPPHALLVATATDFDDTFHHVVEEVMHMNSEQTGTTNDQVRADMVLFEYPNGGAVFTTGSIAWSACLSYNDYDNNVSRITANVLRKFASDDPLP
ncbi:MAG: LamG domain-containing protein [Acidimicrobiia bacterium]|nr:LamG domain-containing protein [Acidimicrobiia bacterium]